MAASTLVCSRTCGADGGVGTTAVMSPLNWSSPSRKRSGRAARQRSPGRMQAASIGASCLRVCNRPVKRLSVGWRRLKAAPSCEHNSTPATGGRGLQPRQRSCGPSRWTKVLCPSDLPAGRLAMPTERAFMSSKPSERPESGTPDILPRPDFHFPGSVGRTYLDSDPAQFPQPVQRAEGRAEHRAHPARRRRLRAVQHVRRRHPVADDGQAGRRRAALQPLPHDGALQPDARGADHRPQPPLGVVRRHHRGGDRLRRLHLRHAAGAAARSARCCGRTAT